MCSVLLKVKVLDDHLHRHHVGYLPLGTCCLQCSNGTTHLTVNKWRTYTIDAWNRTIWLHCGLWVVRKTLNEWPLLLVVSFWCKMRFWSSDDLPKTVVEPKCLLNVADKELPIDSELNFKNSQSFATLANLYCFSKRGKSSARDKRKPYSIIWEFLDTHGTYTLLATLQQPLLQDATDNTSALDSWQP